MHPSFAALLRLDVHPYVSLCHHCVTVNLTHVS